MLKKRIGGENLQKKKKKWKTFGGRIDRIWTNTVVNGSRDWQDAHQSHLFFLGPQLDSIPGLHSISWQHATEFQGDRKVTDESQG